MGMVINTAARFGVSPFERSIQQLGPIVHARFRDSNFNTQIADSSGNNRHLLKQIAAATRSAVPTRTTHPGGALFPSVTYDNWGTQGTFYKRAAESLLSGATEYTALISFREIKRPATDAKAFALGSEDVAESGTNDLALLKFDSVAGDDWWKHWQGPNLRSIKFTETGRLDDGVNRLMIVRYDAGTIYRVTTSKPGHELLIEGTATNTGALDTLNRALLLNARADTNTGSSTTLEMVVDQIALFDTDIGATAEADLHSKWMDEVAGAGYYPSMMQFDGSTGFYSKTGLTASGNKVTGVIRFSKASFSGGGQQQLMRAISNTRNRLSLVAFSSDFATADFQDTIAAFSIDSAGTAVCRLVSPTGYLDGEEHTLFYSFDGDNGTAVLRIDGDDADDTGNASRITPATGTLDTTAAGMTFVVGATQVPNNYYGGEAGFTGYADAYLTNHEDFMDGNLPKPIDEKDWTEFGSSQPLVFAHDGDLENNKGSAGDFTKNGSVTRTVGGSP